MAKWLDQYEQGGLVLKKKTKDNYGTKPNVNDVKVSAGPNFVGEGYTAYNWKSPAWGGQFQMGGSLPGSVGFMYARTQNPAPSNGKYAKKTQASAQNGQEMKYYQDGLDFKPKSISQDGGLFNIDTRAAQDATRNVIPRKMTAAEKKEAKASGDAARKRTAEKTKEILAERKRNISQKGDLSTPGSWHIEDKARLFPSSVGGAGEIFDEYINPATYVGVLADALGESIAEKDPKAIATSLALAAGTGALSGPAQAGLPGGSVGALEALKTPEAYDFGTSLTGLESAKNTVLSGLQSIAKPLQEGAAADLFSLDKLKAVAAPVGLTASEQAYNAALDAQSKYDKELSAFNAMTGQISADNIATRIKAITSSMTNAGFGESDIESALRQIGLLAVGGRVGAMNGGIMDVRRGLVEIPGGYSGNRYKQLLQLLEEARASQDMDKIKEVESDLYREYNKKKDGGLMGLKMGGMPMEMDYRMGGFIPVGSKERADDVPARLSKNEFVMTADAVRAAGGGSVNEGAKRMYQLMNQLEGKLA